MNRKDKNSGNTKSESDSRPSSAGVSTSSSSTQSKKKIGLISSLYNSATQTSSSSNNTSKSYSSSKNTNNKSYITEDALLEKYKIGSPITSEDVLKLNCYTES